MPNNILRYRNLNKFQYRGLGGLGERICLPPGGDREAKHAFADRQGGDNPYGSNPEGVILVVDDEKDVCDSFQDTLPEEGYRVLTALNGKDALALVKKESPDLVLLDIKMPGLDGIEVLEKIKKIDENIAVVMITGYGDLKTAREAMKLGAYDYVTKPFNLDFIKAVLKDALSEK